MANNVEIKAIARDYGRQYQRAKTLTKQSAEIIIQSDTFFNVSKGRLKLRKFDNHRGELIFYHRPDQAGPKLSTYQIVETNKPNDLEAVLAQAYGVKGVVDKTRHLFMLGNTRIHFDEIKSLGKV